MFDSSEIDLLIEGLDSLGAKESLGDLIGLTLGAMVAEGENREKYIEKQRIEREEREEQNKARDERVIIIKAKLIKLRDKALVQDVTSSFYEEE